MIFKNGNLTFYIKAGAIYEDPPFMTPFSEIRSLYKGILLFRLVSYKERGPIFENRA